MQHPTAMGKWFNSFGSLSPGEKKVSLSMLGRLKAFFEKEKVAYRVIPHLEIYTALDVVQSIHAPKRSVAKVIIVRTDEDEKTIMVVLPSPRQIDLVRLAEVMGRGNISLVGAEDIEKRFPGYKAGAIPPFGDIYGLPVYCDSTLVHGLVIFFRAGSHREVIEMRTQDFIRLAHPVLYSFVVEPFKKVSGL